MNTHTFFDFTGYMERVCRQNRLAQASDFKPCTCSGIQHLEGMLAQYKTVRNFVCTSDVCEESTLMRGGGWFKRRVFTVFILARYKYGQMGDYEAKMDTCRELFRQFHTRFIKDAQPLESEMVYMNVADIRSRELGGVFLNGCTGLYLMLSMDEPMDLCYKEEEWETAKV